MVEAASPSFARHEHEIWRVLPRPDLLDFIGPT